MSHYFINDDSLKSERRVISYTLFDKKFNLFTDYGVFSKNELDPGSELLIKTAINDDAKGYILDMGCGYGPIGISLVSFCHIQKVDFVDVNLRALELAKDNANNNGVPNFEIIESDGFEKITNLYDYILINPPIRAGKKVIYKMFLDSYEHLKENGVLLIVIRKDQGAPSTKKYLEEVFGNCEVVTKSKGYHILKSIKCG